MNARIGEFRKHLRAALWWLMPLALIAVLIAVELQFGGAGSRLPADEKIDPKPVVTALLPEFAIEGGTAARTETVQRTLFNPTRRPAPTLATTGATKFVKGQFTLAGTMVTDGGSTAYLREKTSGKQYRVRQGESINGMKVSDIKPDRVRLSVDDDSEDLVLQAQLNPTRTPVSVALTPAGAPMPQVQPAAPVAAAAAPTNEADALAQRRSAARAAAAQAQPGATPAAPSAAVAPAAPAAAAAPAPPDPAWAAVYQNMINSRAQGAKK